MTPITPTSPSRAGDFPLVEELPHPFSPNNDIIKQCSDREIDAALRALKEITNSSENYTDDECRDLSPKQPNFQVENTSVYNLRPRKVKKRKENKKNIT